MSEGERWIDEIMRPLSGIGANLYNPIYSAVARGTPQQGRQLVETILHINKARHAMLMNNEAAAHTPPTSISEYNRRFALNHKIEGFGITGVEQHTPCPFCAAPDFIVHKILETERAMSEGATCRECGRSAKAIIKHGDGGVQFEIVQTGGPDQPDWLVPKMRRV